MDDKGVIWQYKCIVRNGYYIYNRSMREVISLLLDTITNCIFISYFCIFANYSYIIKTGQQIYNNKDLTDTFKVIYP